MAATARISNNRRAAEQLLQLSAKSGITAGTVLALILQAVTRLFYINCIQWRGAGTAGLENTQLRAVASLSQTAGGT